MHNVSHFEVKYYLFVIDYHAWPQKETKADGTKMYSRKQKQLLEDTHVLQNN